MTGTVYFDLETQRSFNDVGGSSNLVKMGVSVACAYSTRTGKYSLYREDELDAYCATKHENIWGPLLPPQPE